MTVMRLPALQVRQGPTATLYLFAVDGKKLHEVCAVSRIRRTDGKVAGYQRPEALAHIKAIRAYLEGPDALMPNALVIAFDSRVIFHAADLDAGFGTLEIPAGPYLTDADKPGFLVDGQQRSAAVRDANVEQFPVPAVAFITDSAAQQRAQFILVNNTKPLPKGLIHELLPELDATLPVALARKQLPSRLLEQLNHHPRSPLYRLIRTPTTPEGVIRDTSLLRTLEASLSDGALYDYRHPDGTGDLDAMRELCSAFYAAAADVFCDAWGLPPRHSRLMHGAGIAALGALMDEIDARCPDADRATFAAELERVAGHCAWTHGEWVFGDRRRRRWDELQNTGTDLRLLVDHLLGLYRRAARAAAA